MGKVDGVKLLLVVVLVIFHFASPVHSHSDGAPPSVCSTMIPGHSGSPQGGHSPYTIQLSSTSVKGGETVDVTLGTTGPPFAGFFSLGTKDRSDLVEPVGEMLVGVQGGAEVGTVRCKTGSGLTHRDSSPKSKVTFQWKVPNEEGNYVLLTTFVKDFGTYWVRESSPVLHVTKDEQKKDTQEAEAQTTPKPVASQIVLDKLAGTYANCGKTKGCFGIPSGCFPEKSCEMLATWRVEGAKYLFQIAGRIPTEGGPVTKGHVSMGLSLDAKMGQDSVVGCVWRGGDEVEPNSFYNVLKGYDNSGFEDKYLGLGPFKNGSFLDGWVFCEFSRIPVFDQPELEHVFNLEKDNYHILLARAPSMSIYTNQQKNIKVEKLGHHPTEGDRGCSAEAFAMTDNKIGGAKSNILVQLHGALMVIVWVMTSSLGIFVARYYKQTHTDFSPFSKPFWFVLHLGSMFVTLGLTFLGVILIFVEIGGYSSGIHSEAGRAHPILGLVLTGICCFQLIIGLLRPHPGTSMRPIFNWAHWTAGTVGHIVGIACIFLAAELSKSGVQNSYPWLLTVGLFVLFHVLMHGTLSIHTVWADKQMNTGNNKLRGISVGPMKPSKPEEAPGTGLRTFLLLLYIVGILSFGITLITLVVKG